MDTFWQAVEAIGGLLLVSGAVFAGVAFTVHTRTTRHLIRAFDSMRQAHDHMRLAFELHASAWIDPPKREYAIAYRGGNMLVQPLGFVEEFHERHGLSLDDWIRANSQGGGQVHSRLIRVVEGWQQVMPSPRLEIGIQANEDS